MAFSGPLVPGPEMPEFLEVPDDQSLDALSGHFKIFQYKKGHRYSTDDLLVAWYGTAHAPSAPRVLDLGSGIGSVGMVAAWRLPGSQFVTIEAQSISVELAKKSIRYNGIENRYEIRQGDFRDQKNFMDQEEFNLILGSPPYFPLENGIVGNHEQKIACRFEVRGDIADYCQTASEHLASGGVFACIFPVQPPHQEQRVLAAAKSSRLTILRRRDVILKEGEPPLLGLFLMIRETDIPEAFRAQAWVEPPLTIRRQDGTVHPEYSVIKISIGFSP